MAKKSRPAAQPAVTTVPAAMKKKAALTPLSEAIAGSATAVGDIIHQLKQLGYANVEEALGVLRVAGPLLASYLGIDLIEISNVGAALTASAASSVSAAEAGVIDKASYSLGVALDKIRIDNTVPDVVLPPASATTPAAAPPATVNLISEMTPIRDQMHRGTCVAFATLATYEHWLSKHGTPVDLSEQFLYWLCKQHDGYDGEGTWCRVAYQWLPVEGCCLEADWPYNPDRIAGKESQGPPPAGAQVQALSYRPVSTLNLSPTSVDHIKATLASGRCVTFAVPVYNTLMLNREAKKLGRIPNPTPGEIPVGGHAMCFVGYVDEPAVRAKAAGVSSSATAGARHSDSRENTAQATAPSPTLTSPASAERRTPSPENQKGCGSWLNTRGNGSQSTWIACRSSHQCAIGSLNWAIRARR